MSIANCVDISGAGAAAPLASVAIDALIVELAAEMRNRALFGRYRRGSERRHPPAEAGAVMLGLVVAGGLASAEAVEVGDAEVDLSVGDGRLSMTFERAVPLGELIEAVGAEAGFGVSVTGDLGLVQPRSIERRPLDEAIRTLAGDHSLLMIYDEGDEQIGQERLARIVIYAARPPGEREQARARARARQSAQAAEGVSPLADDVAERIRELHAQDTSPGEIAERVGTPVERVRRYLQTLDQ